MAKTIDPAVTIKEQEARIDVIDRMLADPKIGELTHAGLMQSREDALRIIQELEG